MPTVEVGGRLIAYELHGDDGPWVALLHGLRAARTWWHLVVDRIRPEVRVVTLDISGHGESSRSDTYAIDRWAEEVVAVLDEVAADPVLMVGHSMGGRLAAAVTHQLPVDRVRGLLTFDTVLIDRNPELLGRIPAVRPTKHYADRQAALASFRLVPPQPPLDPEVLGPVAAEAVHRTEQGWSLRNDPRVFSALTAEFMDTPLSVAPRPQRYLYGLGSELTVPTVALAARQIPDAEVVGIPDSYHHTPLDAPDACAAHILDAAHAWMHPLPVERTDP